MIRFALPLLLLIPISSAIGKIPHSYAGTPDIEAAAAELRKATAEAPRHSFSRAWFGWELLLRRYIDEGRRDENTLKMIAAHFRGAIFDRYRLLQSRGEEHMFYIFHTSMEGSKTEGFGEGHVFKRDVHGGGGHGGWGSHARMIIFEELVARKVLTRDEQSLFRKIVIQSLEKSFLNFDRLERGANNRPYKNTGGLAAALRIFPDMPRATELRRWIDRQWREFAEHGDIFEVNHQPYGGLHLTGLMEIATQTGKILQPADRKLIYAVARRYLHFNRGMGVRGAPNAAFQVNRKSSPEEIFSNPWQTTYYGDVLIPDFWYRAAQEFGDREFLWAAVQNSIGPEPPEGELLSQWQGAYQRRFAWFVARDMEAEEPRPGSSLSLLSPTIHRIKERLYLRPGSGRNSAFASYYLYDRNNEYMHCFDDAMGRLYEYCVDGARLIGSSGKYNGIFFGQPCYDMLMVRHPADAFPLHAARPELQLNAPFLDQTPGIWRRASCSLPDITHSRTGPDSRNWVFRPDLHDHWTWRRRDDLVGGSAANMDGLVYLNNDYTLRSVTIRLNGNPDETAQADQVFLRNLRLTGPEGTLPLESFASPPQGLEILRRKHSATEAGWEVFDAPKTFVNQSMLLNVEAGYQYALKVHGFSHSFNLAKEYTRVAFDFIGISESPYLRFRRGWRYGQTRSPALVSDMVLNDRTVAPSHDIRGGILRPERVRSEDHAGDSYGSMTYHSYFGAQSEWIRETILTREGILVVRDRYTAGPGTDGYRAGPIWCLRADGQWGETVHPAGSVTRKFENAPPDHDGRRNWFHAPAYDHALWQPRQQKRVLLLFHPTTDQNYGQIQHDSTHDLSRSIRTNSTWAAATMTTGRTKIFLSVLIPYDAGEDVKALAEKTKTAVDTRGTRARIGNLLVEFSSEGTWKVQRP